MTEEERDNDLENLFRKKLENSEIEPGGDLTGRFMSRLGRREFFRFNPLRFNLYYLAAAAAALLAAGILLFSRSDEGILKPAAVNTVPQEEIAAEAWEISATDVKVSGGTAITSVTSAPVAASPAENLYGGAGPAPERKNTVITTSALGDAYVKVTSLERKSDISLRNQLMPVPVIEMSESSGCVPLRISFRNATSGTCSVLWSFGDGGTSSEPQTDYIYDLPGRYTVMLTLTDAKGRTSVSTTTVEAWPEPAAAFEIPENDVSITGGQVIFRNLSTGATQYLWDFGDDISSGLSEPSHKYDRSGKYDVTLIAFSEHGCTDSVTLGDIFTDAGMFVRFPNAFIPNAGGPTGGYYSQRTDEANQVFHAVTSGVSSFNLKIYSKQGLMVFESDDLSMGWDGYYKGQLCTPGVYIWKARGSWRNGQPIVMSGDVTLLKY